MDRFDMHKNTTSELERFTSKYIVNEATGCWEWMTGLDQCGYGQFHSNVISSGKAHRWAYTHYVGDIGDGMGVLHKCDNRRCVNPEHLFLGTQKDNVRDAMSKGRATCQNYRTFTPMLGESHPQAKLNNQSVLEIMSLHRGGASNVAIALLYGVNHSQIANIVNGKKWNHVTGLPKGKTRTEAIANLFIAVTESEGGE
jgi:hypothetical protein